MSTKFAGNEYWYGMTIGDHVVDRNNIDNWLTDDDMQNIAVDENGWKILFWCLPDGKHVDASQYALA